MDEDGFEAHYEVVLVGTGLVQSVLSAALSKRGRRVLHLDHNDFYGGEHHATHSLEQFLSLCERRREAAVREKKEGEEDRDEEEPISSLCEVFEKRGHSLFPPCDASTASWMTDIAPSSSRSEHEEIVLVDCSDNCRADAILTESCITEVRSSRNGSPACRGYLMERLQKTSNDNTTISLNDVTTCHPCFFGYRPDHKQTTTRLLHDSRRFQIDSTPKLLLSAGKMVDAIIASGVGHYLEFKPVESLFYVASKSAIENTPNMASQDLTEVASSLKLWQVPCCKKDIFNTKLFTGLEKRSLMKLMQFAVDYGRAKDGLPVTTLNENELAQGRSLFRPQNKLTPNGGGETATMLKEKDKGIEKSFSEFLNDSTVPPRLQEFVTHALCLDARPASHVLSCSEGLDNLYRHVNAAGRYGETSFLIPVYGTSEFAQAFCRLSAVWGGVFLLRESLSKVLTSTLPADLRGNAATRQDNVGDHDPTRRRAVAVKLTNGKYMACDHLVCDETLQHAFMRDASALQYVMTGDCVRFVQRQMILVDPFLSPALCNAKNTDDVNSTRGVCIFPANTPGLGNSHAMYLVQLDESTQVAPKGAYIAYLMTYISCSRELSGEDAGGVEENDRERAVELMRRATEMLHNITPTSSTDSLKREAFYATFLHPPQPAHALSSKVPLFNASDSYDNVHFCNNSTEQILYIHDAICQAESLFTTMYPDEVFLEDTEENNSAQTRYVPDDDDEGLGAILTSAEQVINNQNVQSSTMVPDVPDHKDDALLLDNEDVGLEAILRSAEQIITDQDVEITVSGHKDLEQLKNDS